MRSLVLIAALAGPLHAEIELIGNVDYVGKGDPGQTLDILVPTDHVAKKRPLVVFIHGGGWSSGRKEDGLQAMRLLSSTGDYVTATINYRLSQTAVWPAQIFDCKAAIRYLRGKADEYGIDAAKVGVIGLSAGGHLVSMLGTCGDVPTLEGDLGQFPKLSSKVQCVVNFSGPVDFLTLGTDTGSENPVTVLLGGRGPDLKERAKKASPVTWVSTKSAPFLTAHGTEDNLVPFSQAEEIDTALDKAGVESHLIAMKGAGHGFGSPALNDRVHRFFDKHLRNQPAEISDEPIVVR